MNALTPTYNLTKGPGLASLMTRLINPSEIDSMLNSNNNPITDMMIKSASPHLVADQIV